MEIGIPTRGIIIKLKLPKTFLALSATILLVATCAALAKRVTVQRDGLVFQQRALFK
jgi:hypothetical protein